MPESVKIVATDLDRTLVWSRRRAGVSKEALAALRCVEVWQERNHAFVTQQAWQAISQMAAAGHLVPVTTRTPEQYRRIQLPPVRWALCLNGGVLLIDGEPDAAHARATAELAAQVCPLPEFFTRVAQLTEAAHIRGLRDADGLFGYFLLTDDPVPADWLAELHDVAAQAQWVVTVESTKIYVMPSTLTKAGGMSRLLARVDGVLLAAAGDSRLDEGLLRAAQHALVPHGSYLHSQGWDGAVTASSGVAAGEEIALWLRGLADSAPVRAAR